MCVNSTFGKCCPCEKKGEGEEIINEEIKDIGSTSHDIYKLEESLINNVDDHLGQTDNILNPGKAENVQVTKKKKRKKKKKNNDEEIIENPDNNSTLYFKISQNTSANTIKQYINNNWYDKYPDKVVALEQVPGAGNDGGVLSVTGQKDHWNITYAGNNCFKYSNCDSSKNTWVIVEIKLKHDSDPVFLYVDTCEKLAKTTTRRNGASPRNVFTNVQLWSLNILAANTRAVTSFSNLFSRAQI